LDGPGEPQRDESIGDLLGRLVDDGRSYAEAEIGLYKAIASHRAVRARAALVSLAAGWFLLVSSMTALVIGAVTGLAQHMSPFLAGLAVGVPMAIGGYLLVSYGWTGVKGLARDKGEHEALERGEQP
jgi:hypothetical protein